MDIFKIDNSISYSRILKDFEAECNVLAEKNTNEYFYNFLDYLEDHNYRKYKEIFKSDFEFGEFIKNNFMKLRVDLFYNRCFFKKIIHSMIMKNLTYFHENFDYLIKLLSFFKMPGEVINLYDESFPQYFKYDDTTVQLLESLFHYQEVPMTFYDKYFQFIKNNKKIVKSILCSKNYPYYQKNIFEKNIRVFHEFKKLTGN